MHTLTPGWVDVDVYGWELRTDDGDTHCNTDIPTDSDLSAQAWANGLLGAPQNWQRITEPGPHGWHHYEAEKTN